MSLRDVLNIVSELLTINNQDPTPHQVIEEFYDTDGHIHQLVRAASGTESTRHLQGTTIQGDRTVVSTHLIYTQRGLYHIHSEPWDTEGIQQYFETDLVDTITEDPGTFIDEQVLAFYDPNSVAGELYE